MTQRLLSYQKDSYLSRLTTRISRFDEQEGRRFAVLEDTVFYPEGGGQPPDHGTIGQIPVIDVQKHAGEVLHYLDDSALEGAAPAAGASIGVTLDWRRRFDHMQQHTGQHLLTAVADTLFGWNTTSFHLSEGLCDIELDTPEISDAQLTELEEAVGSVIREDRTVTTRLVEPERLARSNVRSRGLPQGFTGLVRIVDINGIDECACAGTHLRSTCELEALKLLHTEAIRGGTRLYWIAGQRVLRRLQQHEIRNRRLREILGTSDDELPTVAELKLDQQKQARKRVQALEQRWAEATSEALANRPGPWIEAHFEDVDAGLLSQVIRGVVSRNPAICAFLTAEDAKGAFFALAAGKDTGLDLATVGKAVAETLEGRGGGKGPFFPGRAGSLTRRAEAVDLLER